MMASGLLFSATCGPSAAVSTAVPRDIAIHAHSTAPSWTAQASFRRSATPPRCLAVSDGHVFAVQAHKAAVHVYSRSRGNLEALVSFPDRICCLALAGAVLVLGSADGRLMLWETCSGRQATTPACHVQAVRCLAVTPFHLLSGSDDANVNVWSLARLLEFGADIGHEPDLVLSNHRAPVIDLAVGPSTSAETCLCVTAAKDKTCVLCNYRSGQLLRTVLFPTAPLCISLDPCARALFVAVEDGGLYLVELFGEKPLLGAYLPESPSAVVEPDMPLYVVDACVGPASCLALAHDATTVFTGHGNGSIMKWSLSHPSHPAEQANLNAAVTNLIFAPFLPENKPSRVAHVQTPRQIRPLSSLFSLTTQFEGHLDWPDEPNTAVFLGRESPPTAGKRSPLPANSLDAFRMNFGSFAAA